MQVICLFLFIRFWIDQI